MLSSAPVRSEGMWPLWRVKPRACRLYRCSGPLDFFIIWFVHHCIIFCGNFEVSVQIAAEDGSSERNPFPLGRLKTFFFFPLTCCLPHHGTDIGKVIIAMKTLRVGDSNSEVAVLLMNQ